MSDTVTGQKDQRIEITIVSYGVFDGESLPRELTLQRKLRTIAEDGGRFEIKKFEFLQDEIDLSCPLKRDDNEDEG